MKEKREIVAPFKSLEGKPQLTKEQLKEAKPFHEIAQRIYDFDFIDYKEQDLIQIIEDMQGLDRSSSLLLCFYNYLCLFLKIKLGIYRQLNLFEGTAYTESLFGEDQSIFIIEDRPERKEVDLALDLMLAINEAYETLEFVKSPYPYKLEAGLYVYFSFKLSIINGATPP